MEHEPHSIPPTISKTTPKHLTHSHNLPNPTLQQKTHTYNENHQHSHQQQHHFFYNSGTQNESLVILLFLFAS